MKKLTEIFGLKEGPLDPRQDDDQPREPGRISSLFGMGDPSNGVPQQVDGDVRKPDALIGRAMRGQWPDPSTQRMQRSVDNDVTNRYAKGSVGAGVGWRGGPALGSPQDEPLPDLPLEGPFDDLNKQLGGAQSVARDPRSQQGQVRVGKGGGVQRAQADLDQSRSVFKREAFGADADDIKRQLASGKMDTYSCISRAIKMAGSGKDPVEVASALHDALYGEGSKPQPIKGGSGMGSPGPAGSSSMTSQSVGGLKLQ